ncbi:hypothetical protein HGB07_06475, partial [Candidatus Roizmanbacteria bacterium]|nr:hypothetical protein [Candidatus Roizmanbacteria bacterium]
MRTFFLTLTIFVISLLFYGLTMKGSMGNYKTVAEFQKFTAATRPFESSHERATFSQTVAMLSLHRFDLPKDYADFSAPDVGYLKGKFYSYFPPGISYLIMPLYILGTSLNINMLLAYATIPLCTALSLIFLFLIARHTLRLPLWTSLASVMIFGFATTSWSYAITIYQHSITTLLLLLTFYMVWRYK